MTTTAIVSMSSALATSTPITKISKMVLSWISVNDYRVSYPKT
jgi:hypothetical protein